jgi:hypothetical protein
VCLAHYGHVPVDEARFNVSRGVQVGRHSPARGLGPDTGRLGDPFGFVSQPEDVPLVLGQDAYRGPVQNDDRVRSPKDLAVGGDKQGWGRIGKH